MSTTPFEIDLELDGWCLFWAHLTINDVNGETLAQRRREVAEAARGRFPDTAAISGDPPGEVPPSFRSCPALLYCQGCGAVWFVN